MADARQQLFAFTTKYNGHRNVLENKIYLAEAFDPADKSIIPQWHEFNCIWDTGASNTVITSKVANGLGLIPTGKAVCHTAGGKAIVNTYLVNIKLPNKVAFAAVRVTEGDIFEPHDALIGMDIISKGDLAITNKDGITWMSYQYPSIERIDFVAAINRRKGITEKRILTFDEKRKARNKRKAEAKKRK